MRPTSEHLAVPRYAANATRLAVLTTITDTGRMDYKRRRELYVAFAVAVRRLGVPLYTFELVTGDTSFLTPDDGTSVRLRVPKRPVGWQKEHQLNYLIARLPLRYDKVAWIDADVLYMHDAWACAAEVLLEQYGFAQLFEHVHWCGPADNTVETWRSCFAPRWSGDGLVGFAWGAWRQALEAVGGLYWRGGTGANDAIMARTFIKNAGGAPLSGELSHSAQSWQRAMRSIVATPGVLTQHAIRHLWHGPVSARRYGEWDADLIAAEYDADRDCYIDGPFVRLRRPDLLPLMRRHGCA